MANDPRTADEAVRDSWARAADAWERRQQELGERTAAVSRWMVDAIDPQPGERVLELAAGPGETGFIAAERLGPSGSLLSTDQSAEMVAVAQRRASALGVQNVEFAVLDAQELTLEPASFDAVLCRFAYMLMGDPDAAFRGTHRVLRPGGRLALAVWDYPQQNLWMAVPAMTLRAHGAMEAPSEDEPTPFSMADRDALRRRLADTGFSEIHIGEVSLTQQFPSFEQYWEITQELSPGLRGTLEALDDEGVVAVRDDIRKALGQFATDDGALEIPGSAVVASARA